MDGARIGKIAIYPGAVSSANPQDLKYNNEKTFVEIGDNVTIRECVTINKGTNDRLNRYWFELFNYGLFSHCT